MRITSKGQVTIPQKIRERFNLLPNTEVDFEVKGNTVVLRKKTEGKSLGRNLVERLKGKATVKMTTDEIMDLTRGEK